MEFVCIEAKTFMEMNEALEAVAKKMSETCGSGISGMDGWIDNQEACMLMDASPRKMLQLRRSRAIPYSYIDRKVYYKRQDISKHSDKYTFYTLMFDCSFAQRIQSNLNYYE